LIGTFPNLALSFVIWAVGFADRKHGSTVLLILSVLLFLVGGGVAQVAFTPIVWTVSTRINKPLTWWKNALPANLQIRLAKLWNRVD
jgi:hypothetical protein